MVNIDEVQSNSWNYNWVIFGVLTVLVGVVCARNKARTVLVCKIVVLSVKLILVHFHTVMFNMAKRVSRRLTRFLVRCLSRGNDAKVIPGANAHRPVMRKPQPQSTEYYPGFPGYQPQPK